MTFTNLDLKRGTIVMAAVALDPEGANVHQGTLGVVFEEANYHGDGNGPIVRWMSLGVCNVYPGQVLVVSRW